MSRNIQVEKIFDQSVSERDLLVDDLGDDIRAGEYCIGELDNLVLDLLDGLAKEKVPSVRESVMNVLSEVYPSVQVREEIEKYTLDNIYSMSVSEQVHALSILSDSTCIERGHVFETLSRSENRAVRDLAKACMK